MSLVMMDPLETILEDLDRTREQLLVAIEVLPDEALVVEGVFGRFSIGDLLALFTAWEAEMVTALMRLKQGKAPDKLLAALADRERYREACFAENQERLLDQIFDDFPRVRIQLEDWLSRFSEKDLTDPKRYKWFGGKSLASVVADVTWKHEQSYLSAVEIFVQQWREQEETADSATIIPLTNILGGENS